jgi:RNA polymerase sigma factor (sigma-70 family)
MQNCARENAVFWSLKGQTSERTWQSKMRHRAPPGRLYYCKITQVHVCWREYFRPFPGGSMDDLSGNLLARLQGGDSQAAVVLFHRYTDRLIALARSRLPAILGRRVDPEDVVQSVYRSFFARAAEGRYVLQRGGDLWRLLVTITLHKVYHQVEHYAAGKRTPTREHACGIADPPAELLAREPSPVEAAALADEVEQLFRRLEPDERRVLELRLMGYHRDEIADQMQRSLRTVCRILDKVKHQLQQQRGDVEVPSVSR